MSYYARRWLGWADRIVVVVCVMCLLIGMSAAHASDRGGDARDDQYVEREPGVTRTPFPPARLPVIRPDGVLAFDYMGTVAWSRFMVSETPPDGRVVWVLTYINGPGGLRPVFLPGIEVTAPR